MTTGLAVVHPERIKLAVRGLYDAQKLRIQLQLRIERLVREEVMTEEEARKFFKLPFSWFEKAEKEMEKLVVAETKNHPVSKKWIRKVRGVGPRLSGLLVANVADIERFPNVAKLWAYAGLHVKDGKAVKRAKGQRANWNAELKTTCWKMAQSFVKAGGAYRTLYDNYKTRIIERETMKGNDIYQQVNGKWAVAFESQRIGESHEAPASQMTPESQPRAASQRGSEAQSPCANQSNTESLGKIVNQSTVESRRSSVTPNGSTKCPEWTLGRVNNMALRYVAKIFLSHLWQVWREMEGLPTREPYAVEYLGHTTVLDPWDFIEDKTK